MSNLQFTDFIVLDYNNQNVLSSYALEETPLKFIPNEFNDIKTRILWDFGDNTFSSSISAIKFYENPGIYNVKMTTYDCFSNAIVSIYNKNIFIYDFLNLTFNIEFKNPSFDDNFTIECGKISGPIFFNATYPKKFNPIDIFYRVKNSDSGYYFDGIDNKYNHLKKTYSFFEKISNNKINSEQFLEIDKISPETIPIYAKLTSSGVELSEPGEDSFFVGLSGVKEVYFKDDSTGSIQINTFFDKSKFKPESQNILSVSLSAEIIENEDADSLSITSNGLDGEFFPINSFNIDNFKFSNIKIPFVVKIKDVDNFSLKNFPLSTMENTTITVLSSNEIVDQDYYDVETVKYENGSFLGTITFNLDHKVSDVQIDVVGNYTNNQNTTFSLRGSSNRFDVYPQNFINLLKINEDFDSTETFKDLRFQEFLIDKGMLFDDFMRSIFGDSESTYDTLGKKIYEKIMNFIDNVANVDRDEIFSLISQMEMVGMDSNLFGNNSFTYPEKIKRLLDISSISKNKLLGTDNQFRENFNTRGQSSKEIFGINLGNEIDTNTFMVSAGTPIVALEKFSGDYILLNTEQPVEHVGNTSYPLSAYDFDWGWPLVLPDDYTYDNLVEYYIFFEYVDQIDGTIYNNTILRDFTIENALSSENVLLDNEGTPILDNEENPIVGDFIIPDYRETLLNISLRDTLYQSLSLVK